MARVLGRKVKAMKKTEKKGKVSHRPNKDRRHNINQKINQWIPSHMQGAIDEYNANNGKVSIRQLARAWQVPRSTLKMRLEGKVQGSGYMSGRKPIFDSVTEDKLVSAIKELSQRGFPLGMKEVRHLAFSYASQNGISGFSEKKKAAGYEWFYSFLKRHPDIGVRKPEPLSVARAMGMNKTVVSKWFSELEACIDKLGIKCMPDHFWNVDETGLQDYFVSQKVVGEVGKPCYQATASEKGETTTIIAAFNAMGIYVKPLVIMRGKRLKPEWLDGISGSFAVTLRMSENGWVNKELFVDWAEMFVSTLPKHDDKHHVLFLDGHGSHVYNMDFIELMKKHKVEVWCFPAHTTHWLQPADRTFFRSLKHWWSEDGLKLARISAGRKLTRQEFLKLFASAWNQSATVENALSGFCATGLFPLDRSKINSDAFLPSQTTERQLLPDQSTTADNSMSPEHQLATNTCEEQRYDSVDLLTP